MPDISTLWDIVSLSIIPLILSPLYFWYTTKNTFHLIGFAGVVLTSLSVDALKRYIFPSQHRPRGAKGCDLFCIHETDENRPGMPSGHAATVAFYGIFYNIKSPIYLIYVLLMAVSRYMKNCHSIPQIVAGLLFGAVMGLVFKQY
jgi:membrane-associated phospholipid phosphatase